ncbi:uncharacterized protein [Triticum aestivum]|uniref:uncharacterized protein n=1 Tax=Triticum aestivum TaxID=4565 RepID=UPI0008433620|nr:uncharacterized protein LOC123162526 [Triticum aestivum]
MRPQVLLVAFVVLAELFLSHSQVANPWPSCDNCDSCTKSNPPGCKRWNYLRSGFFYHRPSARAVSCPPSGHNSFQCTTASATSARAAARRPLRALAPFASGLMRRRNERYNKRTRA